MWILSKYVRQTNGMSIVYCVCVWVRLSHKCVRCMYVYPTRMLCALECVVNWSKSMLSVCQPGKTWKSINYFLPAINCEFRYLRFIHVDIVPFERVAHTRTHIHGFHTDTSVSTEVCVYVHSIQCMNRKHNIKYINHDKLFALAYDLFHEMTISTML